MWCCFLLIVFVLKRHFPRVFLLILVETARPHQISLTAAAWRWMCPSVGLFPYWRTYVNPYMVSFAGKRHTTSRFPGTPSYIARQKCWALPSTPQRACKWRFVNERFVRVEGISPFCSQFPKTSRENASLGTKRVRKSSTQTCRRDFLSDNKRQFALTRIGAIKNWQKTLSGR